ncbi:MAG: hypothetical protein WCE61_00105 [Candidatus Acidiferrum sp.]
MPTETEPKTQDTAGVSRAEPQKEGCGRRQAGTARWSGGALRGVLSRIGWPYLPAVLLLAGIPISIGFADTTADQILLPIEVLSADGAAASRSAALNAGQVDSVKFVWLEIHGLQYGEEASVQVNSGDWMPLNNSTVTVSEPDRSFGGIGGGFSTLAMTLPLGSGTVNAGTNTIRFRFNQTDGFSSMYRVLRWNFLTAEGKKVIPAEDFVEDAPEKWTPPLPDEASIEAGRKLWHTASLAASSRPNSPRIQAHCGDCHAQDGRDLKYFNFSNDSIVDRARFHGLTKLEGEQIASYIRSLRLPNPGRPWNPPYQPGPGVDEQPVSSWAAGAGLDWVLEKDKDGLRYLLGANGAGTKEASNRAGATANLLELAGKITSELFRPDGNLDAREIPIVLQLPDWSHWLPRVHPKDAWGASFARSEFAEMYDGETTAESQNKRGAIQPLRKLLAAGGTSGNDIRPITAAFDEWSKARREFLKRFVEGKTEWTPELTKKVYSTQLWQLAKTWEMMQESGLEGRGRDFFGSGADERSWLSSVPAETAPSATHIPDGAAGVGGSALTNEYFSAAWYELQILLNNGNHRHRDREPVDWVYVIGRFPELQAQTHQPEPVRLLVAVIKALQSTDPRVGPEDYGSGWRPERNIDPRIMISSVWEPVFKPLPEGVHRALTTSMLAAWMDKNLEYPIEKYLPMGTPPRPAYAPPRAYGKISGGKVWEASRQFRDAGVPLELVQRLERWGLSYSDRAARVQY